MATRFPKARRLRKRQRGKGSRTFYKGGARNTSFYKGGARNIPIYKGGRRRKIHKRGQRGGSWEFWTKDFWTKEAGPWFEKTGKRVANTLVEFPTLGIIAGPFKDV